MRHFLIALYATILLAAGVGLARGVHEVIAQRYLPYDFYYSALSSMSRSLNGSSLSRGSVFSFLILLGGILFVKKRKKIIFVLIFSTLLFKFLIPFCEKSILLPLSLSFLLAFLLYPFFAFALKGNAASQKLIRSIRAVALFSLVSILFLNGVVFFFRTILQKHLTHQPNVIFILSDALRADHLGCYGYPRPTSPFLDRFSEKSVLFTECISQGSATFPSLLCLLTSKYASSLFAFTLDRRISFLSPGEMTLAEFLFEKGYVTAAISSSPIVQERSSRHTRGGFAQGFFYFDGSPGREEKWNWRSAEEVNQKAIHWLRRNSRKRFFLYLHYMEPHDVYHSPEPYNSLFSKDSEKGAGRPGNPVPLWDRIRKGEEVNPAREELQGLIDHYDGEIRYLDTQIEILFSHLEKLGLLENSLIIFTSDHGEAFFEHGEVRHGYGLHQEQIHVPLLVYGPMAGFQGRKVSQFLVQGIDILPTVLDSVGMKKTEGVDGRSLRALLSGGNISWRTYALSESPYVDQKALLTKEWKYIHDFGGGFEKKGPKSRFRENQLYHLESDPQESKNVITLYPERVHEMYSKIFSLLSVPEKERILHKKSIPLGIEEKETLKSLGYLH